MLASIPYLRDRLNKCDRLLMAHNCKMCLVMHHHEHISKVQPESSQTHQVKIYTEGTLREGSLVAVDWMARRHLYTLSRSASPSARKAGNAPQDGRVGLVFFRILDLTFYRIAASQQYHGITCFPKGIIG